MIEKFNINNGILIRYFGGEREVVIPNGITTIGDYAFYNCSSLNNLSIPNSVKHIGYGAFLHPIN